jgi:hypothetical protein
MTNIFNPENPDSRCALDINLFKTKKQKVPEWFSYDEGGRKLYRRAHHIIFVQKA